MKNPAALAPLIFVVTALVVGTVYARRRGYGVGGRTVVRCRDGHLYTTIWIPGASFKSLRLGWYRWQYCPVGRHWSSAVPVRDDELTPQERALAEMYHDAPVP
ncbi:hypothetical protein ACQEWB_28060 [Streptomyces sp. CA-249302]|uniref:hypothetical protein n=1 Tax=Streptomyces sp. CA-249302 TaxID=3240058 RepID=UPI003D8DF562